MDSCNQTDRLLKWGGGVNRAVGVALALVVSLLFATTAQANAVPNIIRGTDSDTLTELFTFTYEKTGDRTFTVSFGEEKYLEGLFYGDSTGQNFVEGKTVVVPALWVDLAQGYGKEYTGYAASISGFSKDENLEAFLNAVSINGTTVAGNVEDVFFYGLERILFSDAPRTNFVFDSNVEKFTFTFYGQTETPEPATLAVLGLGLGGLALARRRQSRNR